MPGGRAENVGLREFACDNMAGGMKRVMIGGGIAY